jgi:hypothetical protein
MSVLEDGLSVSVSDVTGYELDGEVTLTITRTGVYSTQVVDFATDPVSARTDDFTAMDGSLVFEPGETVKKVDVSLVADDTYEYNEYFKLMLHDSEGVFLDSARVYISDENRNPVVVVDAGEMDVGETTLTLDVLANDYDPDPYDSISVFRVEGEVLSPTESVTLDSGALVTLNGDGTLTYDLNGALAWGTPDQFEYTVSDENGGLDTGNAYINFKPWVVDFESAWTPFETQLPLGYEGFDWVVPGNLLYVLNGDDYGVSGYRAAGTMVGFNPSSADPVTITASAGPSVFMISEVEMTSAWNDSQDVRLNGYLDGNLVGTQDVQLNDTTPLLVEFDWGVIDELEIDALNGAQMVFDNFLFMVPADFGLIV